MLWWFAYNISNSSVNEYSIMDTSNYDVGKYYVIENKNESCCWL